MRHPAPVARIFIKGFLAGDVGDPVPLVARTAVKLLVQRRNVERIVLAHGSDSSDKENVHAEAAGALDDGRTERNREVPLPSLGLFVVGIFDLDRTGVAEAFVQSCKSRCVASLVEACFVVSLANIGTDGDIVVEVVVTAHVHADGKAVEGSCFVVENVHVDGRLAVPFVLVRSHAKVVPSDRSRELEQVAVVVNRRLGAVAFDHEVVSRLFLEAANLYIVELRRNARNVGVATTGIVSEFCSGRMRNRIPVNLGFVFAIRGVPHDFGAVGRNVTDGDVCDVGVFNRVERRERERSLCAVDQELCLVIFRLVSVGAGHIEVVGGAGSQIAKDDFVLDACGGACCVQAVLAFGRAVRDCCRAALGKLDHYNCRVHAHVADFDANVRSRGLVDFLRGEHACTDQGCCCVDTCFRKVVVFPALVVRNPGVCQTGGNAAKEGAYRRIVLVACARHVLAFGVSCAVVRMGVVLVAHAQDKRNVPRVHAEHVVELVDTKLAHFIGFPIWSSHDGKSNSELFNFFCDIGVGENFKDVTHLVTVVNPSLVGLHGIPGRVKCQCTSHLPCGALAVRNVGQGNGSRTVSGHIFEVQNHVGNAVFYGIDPFRFSQAVFIYSLIFIGENQFVQGVKGVCIRVCPAGVLYVLQEALVVGDKPTAGKGACTIHVFLALDHVLVAEHVVGISLFAGGVKECHGSESHFIVEFVVSVVSGAGPTSSLLVVGVGLALGHRLCEVVHFLSDFQAAIGESLVFRIIAVHLGDKGQACGSCATDVGTDFTETDRSGGRTTTVCCRCRIVDRELVLVFGAAPPGVVGTKVTHGKSHVVDNALGTHVGAENEVCTVL